MRVKNTYAEYRHDVKWAFVPAEKGRWIRTHPAALFFGCSCGAVAGKPCHNEKGYQVPVCRTRARLYQNALRNGANLSLEGVVTNTRNAQLKVVGERR